MHALSAPFDGVPVPVPGVLLEENGNGKWGAVERKFAVNSRLADKRREP